MDHQQEQHKALAEFEQRAEKSVPTKMAVVSAVVIALATVVMCVVALASASLSGGEKAAAAMTALLVLATTAYAVYVVDCVQGRVCKPAAWAQSILLLVYAVQIVGAAVVVSLGRK